MLQPHPTANETCQIISLLLENDPDLLTDFAQFIPSPEFDERDAMLASANEAAGVRDAEWGFMSAYEYNGGGEVEDEAPSSYMDVREYDQPNMPRYVFDDWLVEINETSNFRRQPFPIAGTSRCEDPTQRAALDSH